MVKKIFIKDIIDNKLSIKEENAIIDNSIEKLYDKYGQLYPLIVDSNYNLIDGKELYQIMLNRNRDEVYVNIIETKNIKQTYLELKMIRTTFNAAKALKYLKEIDIDNNCLPFDKKQIHSLLDILNLTWKTRGNKNIDTFF